MSVDHYLLTVDTNSQYRAHGYIMTDTKDQEKAINLIIDKIEELGLIAFPIVLQTKLTKGVDIVRDIISKQNPKTKELLEKATVFHFTAWFQMKNCPDDIVLMGLHL